MSFVEEAESWRAKLHVGAVRMPLLVGITALVVVVAVAAFGMVAGALSSDGFALERGGAVGDAGAGEPAGDGSARAGTSAQGANGNAANQGADAGSAGQSSAAEPKRIVVHVAGAVAAPGVRELAEGARVQDAVDASGGFAADAAPDAVNLARTLEDGEQVLIPTQAEVEAGVAAASAVGASSSGTVSGSSGSAGSGTGSGGSAPFGANVGGKVNLNTATAAELNALPGIGPATADKIVADRTKNGPFSSVDDLQRVAGIGAKKLDGLRDLVCV